MPLLASIDPTPHAHFPKQAVVLIHGMGEQMPMDTIKGFVRAVWESDEAVARNGMPDPTEVWSKPDLRTGSLELRRITTRPTTPTTNFPTGARTDFYELYWADLSGGSTLSDVENWIFGLLLRNPFSQVPAVLRPVWLLLLLLTIGIFYLAAAAAFKPSDVILGIHLYGWMAPFSPWLGPFLGAALGYFANALLVPYFGRVVRYTRATPQNIAARKDIRERGLALLNALHDGSYDRIILVGHSLGTILGYDLLSYFWASRPAAYTVAEDDEAFPLLRKVEQAVRACSQAPTIDNVAIFEEARRAFCAALRRRPKPSAPSQPDTRWLITDFITLGSPLTHASVLLASDEASLRDRLNSREYPAAPPLPELLDPKNVARALSAGFELDSEAPSLVAFPLNDRCWQLHHAAPFSAVRWTNIYDPSRFLACGDLISGPVSPLFGAAAQDIDLAKLRGRSWAFTHTKYWALAKNGTAPQTVVALRQALNLTAAGPQI